MSNPITRPNWYDFQHVSLEDMNTEQTSNLSKNADTNRASLGSGVRLEFPEEPVLFDSDSLSVTQSGYVGTSTFDGRGILDAAYVSTDADEGNQLTVTVTDSKLDGVLSMLVTIIGKLFDNSLVYEHLEFTNNGLKVTKNSFIEVTNVLFQNFLGNANTSVDGYGSYNAGGRVVLSEASSMRISPDLIAAEQIRDPDIYFRDYKTYDSGKSLQTILEEAIGTSNDIDALGINTVVTSTRTFAAGATTDIIYGQKFSLKDSSNIQKVTLLLALTSGSTWTGSLVVEIRPLQTSTTCTTDFLPDSEIEFDPNTVPIEALSLDQADLAARGVVLTSTPQPVDFIFTNTNMANPTLSLLEENAYYVLAIRRTGSTATGTLALEEAINATPTTQRLTVFQNSQWTDIEDSTLWYRIWSNSVKVANGIAYDTGIRITTSKTYLDNNGVVVQNLIENIQLVNTSEGAENYLTVRKDLGFTDVESHPRTGDSIFSRENDTPKFEVFEQADVLTLLTSEPELNVLARIKDNNPKSNPEIAGTLDYPGLALGNIIDIINPTPDLLVQNVVGSTIIPNTAKPSIEYRIIKQEIFTDLYGDTDSTGIINVSDANRVNALDGYAPDLSSGTIAAADQLANLLAGEITIAEILRADVNADGYVDSQDFTEVSNFILNGTAFTAGSSFTRARLTVEPILNPSLSLNSDADSTLQLEVLDADLIDNVSFTTINYQINFVSVWDAENIEILDLRRYVNTTFIDFAGTDLQSTPESGGKNNFFVGNHLYLGNSVLELDGTHHPLDYERNVIELELPSGETEGRINIFDQFIVEQMSFSDGTLVSSTAINNNQVRFEVSIASHVKDLDGYDFDGYNDGYGSNADEAIGTYMEHDSGILRIRAYNIVRNEFFPELRSRILVAVSLKKAGFKDAEVYVNSTDLVQLLEPIT